MKKFVWTSACGFALTTLLALTGCENPHHDMGKQEKYNTFEQSEFFPDGASARPLPAGVIPRESNIPGYPFAKAEPLSAAVPTDAKIPFQITQQTLREGRENFNIYCSVCHGRLGNSEGMIVQRGLTNPPSFHTPRLKQTPDSHFYNVITYGYGQMFSYNDRVPADKRWQIVAYIRALQAVDQSASPGIEKTLVGRGDPYAKSSGGER